MVKPCFIHDLFSRFLLNTHKLNIFSFQVHHWIIGGLEKGQSGWLDLSYLWQIKKSHISFMVLVVGSVNKQNSCFGGGAGVVVRNDATEEGALS